MIQARTMAARAARRSFAAPWAMLLGASAAALLSGTATAQQGQEDLIGLCRTAQSETARIACLEAVVRGETPVLDAPAPAPAPQPLPQPGAALVVNSDAPEAESFGAEQLGARRSPGARDAEPRLLANVSAVSEAARTRLQVELDNGQVWRQTMGEVRWDPRRYSAPSQVEIWQSRFGGYRMRLVGQDLILRVERVR